MQLTPNFKLEEFLRSETAERLGIKNEPDTSQLAAIKVTAQALQKIRTLLDVPISINSGFRSDKLNRAVGGVPNSDHNLGYAADIRAPKLGTIKQLAEAIVKCGVKFDQIIYEQDNGAEWVHISFNPRMRGQVLSWKRGRGYVNGLVKL